MTNILENYKRHPKIYITLPSGGKFYKDGIKLVPTDNTLGIRAMTARDELLLKSPDALLNGDAIIKIIQSCCPDITMDPKDLIAPDVEVILLAIFCVSYDNNFEFDSKCPACNHENTFTADINGLLGSIKSLNPPYIIKHKINDVEIDFYIKPESYQTLTMKSLSEFEHTKMLQAVANPDLDDEVKLKKFGESFSKMAENNFEIIAHCIEKIVTPEGECSDHNQIKEFIFDVEKDLIDKITQQLKEINDSSYNSEFHAQCQNKECNHTWTTKIEFDPSRFFVSSFKR